MPKLMNPTLELEASIFGGKGLRFRILELKGRGLGIYELSPSQGLFSSECCHNS